ncbi:solute carrier family 35 member G1-like [Apostichopus japonicus]|uniref:solute carrier family 35 member G1-like n=1 Tax=Stichopus japonicus TaxID=307972 RepID=UPI003AB272E4
MDNPTVELEDHTTSTKCARAVCDPDRPNADDIDSGHGGELPGHEDSSTKNKRLSTMLRKFTPSRGMMVAFLSAVLFSCVDVSIEISTHEVHPNIVLTLYPNVIMLFSLIGIIFVKVEVLYDEKQYLFLFVSAGFYAAGITCLALAISKIPVGDAVAILNCMPIFGGIFGWILLKQSLRLLDLLFTILCIAGVVLIARPSFIFPASSQNDEFDSYGLLFAIGAACFIGFAITAGRKLQEMGIHVLCILFANALLTFLLNAIICSILGVWSAPSPSYYWAISLAPGVFDFFAQICVFLAVKMERAVMVTIILTSEIVFTFIMQIFIIKIIPHWYSAIGSFCILLSCIGMSIRKEGEEVVAG